MCKELENAMRQYDNYLVLRTLFEKNFMEWCELRKKNNYVSGTNISKTSLMSQITLLRGDLLKLHKSLDEVHWWCKNE